MDINPCTKPSRVLGKRDSKSRRIYIIGKCKCQVKDLGHNPINLKELLCSEQKRDPMKCFKKLSPKITVGHTVVFKNKRNLFKSL